MIVISELMLWGIGVTFLLSTALVMLLIATQSLHSRFTVDGSQGVHKFHVAPTSRIGGVGIYLSMYAGLYFMDKATQSALICMLAAGALAFVVGLAEDITKRVSVRTRLLATVGSGLIACLITGYAIRQVGIPAMDAMLAYGVVAVAFTAFAVGGIANAINIIDGFNGLASGTVLVIVVALSAMAMATGDNTVLKLAVLLGAAVAGFFVVNWPRGGIFLGDGGAYFVGFAIAWVSVLLLARNPEVSAWAPLMACAYPFLEVMFSFARKSMRVGHHPGQPDRVHLHMLVYRRLVRRVFPRVDVRVKNGMTSPFAWAFASFGAVWAIAFYDSSIHLIAGFVGYALAYRTLYLRLSQFRWCVRPFTNSVPAEPSRSLRDRAT